MTAIINIDGVDYVTTSQACDMLAGSGVTPVLIRRWTADPNIPLDIVRDPSGKPVRIPAPGGRGSENVYRWADVVDAEWRTRTARGGRPRKTTAAQQQQQPVGDPPVTVRVTGYPARALTIDLTLPGDTGQLDGPTLTFGDPWTGAVAAAGTLPELADLLTRALHTVQARMGTCPTD